MDQVHRRDRLDGEPHPLATLVEGIPIRQIPALTAIIAILTVIIAAIRPRWFRGFYRGGMTISFHIGQTIGKILLILFFFLFVTPLGLLLRLFGKDLLLIKKNPEGKTYWHPARNNREFDRMF